MPFRHAALPLTIILAIVLVIFCQNRNISSDPRPNIYTAEAIIDHGTIRLDSYGEPLTDQIALPYKDHYYSYFPIGTPLFSLPVIAAYRALGLHVAQHETDAQVILVILASVPTFLLLFATARLFLEWNQALAVTALFWFGSSLTSTNATALWTHDFATMWTVTALYLTLSAVRKSRFDLWPWIAACAFSAYLCRPTMILFIGCLLLFLASYDIRAALKASLLMVLGGACFIAWSYRVYGDPLPPYYGASRLAGGWIWPALYGNLLSPARGLLIYSPFIVTVLLCWRRSGSLGLKPSWLLLGVVWPVAHLVAISRFPHWWAGFSYGARLMSDVLPGLFLLAVRAWPRRIDGHWQALAAGLLGLSGAAAIYVNVYQGLFNPYAYRWIAEPNIDTYPAYLFDWHYPQFLHDATRHERRMAKHRQSLAALGLPLPPQEIAAAPQAPPTPLDIDTLSPADFARPERFVPLLYQAVLHRIPADFERDYYVEHVKTHPGQAISAYISMFMGAGEYADRIQPLYPYTAAGDAKFITDGFEALLHRPATAQEIAHYQLTVIAPAIPFYRPEDHSYFPESENTVRTQILAYLFALSLWRDEAAE